VNVDVDAVEAEVARAGDAEERVHVRPVAVHEPADRVHPVVVTAMEEVGIDLRGHSSKTIDAFLGERWDYVITVCDDAAEACPIFPGPVQRIHWSFPDPAKVQGDEAIRLAAFRRVRDGLRERLDSLLAEAGIDA